MISSVYHQTSVSHCKQSRMPTQDDNEVPNSEVDLVEHHFRTEHDLSVV